MFDKYGYLLDFNDWEPAVAESVAKNLNIKLNEDIWLLINYIQKFYLEYEFSPNIKQFVLFAIEKNSKISSIYLFTIFKEQPIQKLCKLAGMPKPLNCL